MKKIVIYSFLFIFLSLIIFLSYFSYFGIKTKNFNHIIKNTINKFDKNLNLEINYVQLNLITSDYKIFPLNFRFSNFEPQI